MKLYIRVCDGQPFEHPILAENFKAAFPHIDTNNLPSDFSEFERVEPPPFGPYEVYEGVTYELFGSVYRDVHHIREMTEQEKTSKQNAVKTAWAKNGFASWLFDEDTCSFVPPVPYPDDGQFYRWDEDALAWVALS
jgi:hypothetical protein